MNKGLQHIVAKGGAVQGSDAEDHDKIWHNKLSK